MEDSGQLHPATSLSSGQSPIPTRCVAELYVSRGKEKILLPPPRVESCFLGLPVRTVFVILTGLSLCCDRRWCISNIILIYD